MSTRKPLAHLPAPVATTAIRSAAMAIYGLVPILYPQAERAAIEALQAALPRLLPGLFLALDGGDCLTIWARGDDLAHPASQMVRTADNARLFDAIAALLPREE